MLISDTKTIVLIFGATENLLGFVSSKKKKKSSCLTLKSQFIEFLIINSLPSKISADISKFILGKPKHFTANGYKITPQTKCLKVKQGLFFKNIINIDFLNSIIRLGYHTNVCIGHWWTTWHPKCPPQTRKGSTEKH